MVGRLACHKFKGRKDSLLSGWQQMANYCQSKLTYGLNEMADVWDLRLRVPFSCLIVDRFQCGKSELAVAIVRQWRYVMADQDSVYTKRLY